MSSSQQYTESMAGYSHTKPLSENKSNIESLLDEDFLREEEFIDNYIESSLKEGRKSRYHKTEQTNETNNISVKAIKGNPSTGKQGKIIEGFQKVTVSSGSNEVNHFSRSISHDPENDFTDSSDEEEHFTDMVNEEVIVPVKETEKEKSKKLSFSQYKDRKMVDEEKWKYPNDSILPNRSFEEVTFRIESYEEGRDQSDGKSRINMARSPRDGYPDFETHVNVIEKKKHSSENNLIPIEINVSKNKGNQRHIKVLLSPNPHSEENSGFRPIQSSSDHREGSKQQQQQHIIKIKPTAVRRASNTSSDGQVVFKQQIHFQDQLEQRRQSEGVSHIKQIKHIRKSSLPDDSEFRRETDFQLQQQRNLQQRMLQRQHNESRKSNRQNQDSETFKQQQYHQQKLMQHQQHLQRIQQQQQQKRKQQQSGDQHSLVVLNGRVMRRHSFDNSSLMERRQDEEEGGRYFEEHSRRQIKPQRERPQTRERRLSYEQECDKLEEELHHLQAKEPRKQNNNNSQHFLQQQQVTYHHQQMQKMQQVTTSNNYNHQSRHEEMLQHHPQRFISQSATNTPNLQKNRKLDQFLTPDPGKKRGKIPNSLKFQSEDIINDQSKMGERRKSNPNLILGRTDINKQFKEHDIKHISHTLPRSFGRQKKSQPVSSSKSLIHL